MGGGLLQHTAFLDAAESFLLMRNKARGSGSPRAGIAFLSEDVDELLFLLR